MADAQFASSDPAGPDTTFWDQKVYFDGVPRRRREIVATLAATPYMTERAARLFLATAAVADGMPPLSPPAGWFADGSLAAFGFNPDQPREKGRFASGGGEAGKGEKGAGKSKDKEDGTAANPFTPGEKGPKPKGTKSSENGLKVTGRKPGTISEKDFVKSLSPASKAKLDGPRKKVGDHAVVGHLLKEIGSNAGLRAAINGAHNSADIKKHLSKYQVEHSKDGKQSFLHVNKGAKPNEAIKALVQGAARHPELRKHLERAATRNPALRAGLEKSIEKGVKRSIDKSVGRAKAAKQPKTDISEKDFMKSVTHIDGVPVAGGKNGKKK